MATTASPYGLKPLGRLTGNRVNNGAPPNLYQITSNQSGVIAFGAPVTYTTGSIQKVTSTTMNTNSDLYIGIFVGCQYTNPTTLLPQWSESYPGSVVATDIMAYVVDDPSALFQIQATAVSFDALAVIGTSYKMTIPGTPYNTIGLQSISTISLDGASGTSATYPWKIVGISGAPDNANNLSTQYTDVIVQINAGFHVFGKAL